MLLNRVVFGHKIILRFLFYEIYIQHFVHDELGNKIKCDNVCYQKALITILLEFPASQLTVDD